MTLYELLGTLKGLGVTLTLHDGEAITIEPPDVLVGAIAHDVPSATRPNLFGVAP